MEDRGRKAVRLARTEGIGRMFQRATDPDRWGHHYVSAALALFDIQKKMLHGTDPERKAAKALWQSACGLGRGQRTSLERSRLRRWVRAIVDSSASGIELRTAIHEATLSSKQHDLFTVIEAWGTHDHDGHGTGMCGLAAYGPLELRLESTGPIAATHWIESVKLRGPDGHPETLDGDLWGQFTQRAAYEIEYVRASRPRLFCLALTSKDDADRGTPSSWSGAIDQLASGYGDGTRRLIVISAGNVTGDDEWAACP